MTNGIGVQMIASFISQIIFDACNFLFNMGVVINVTFALYLAFVILIAFNFLNIIFSVSRI